MRARLQIVFQDPFASLDPTMSVAEIVAEPLRALRPGHGAAERSRSVSRPCWRASDSAPNSRSAAAANFPAASASAWPSRAP